MKLGVFSLVFAVVAALAAGAQDLLTCDFSGSDPGLNLPWTPTSQLAAGVTFSGWTSGGAGVEARAWDDALGFAVNGPADAPSTLAYAIAGDQYLGFTLSPANGTALNLSGLQFQFSIQRESWHAPRQYAVCWSLDGFDEASALFHTAAIDYGDFSQRDFSFFVPLSGYDGITAPVEVRLYAYTAQYSHTTSLAAFGMKEFLGNVFTLAADAGTGGSVAINPDTDLLPEGAAVAVSATPDPGYHFAGWSGDFTGLGNPLSFSMAADTVVTAQFAPNPAPHMAVGTNLGAIVDWGTHWVFTDMFKRMRTWISRNADGSGAWDSGLSYRAPLDADGWPTHIPFDPGTGDPPQFLHTTVVLPPAIGGDFTMTYEGQGTLRIIWSGGRQTLQTSDSGPHQFTFAVDDPAAGVFLEFQQSLAGDPLRNFHIALPGFADSYTAEPFHPLFLQRLSPFTNLRFMDWGQTNASPLVSWDQRTTPASYTQARGEGVSLETMALLANTLQQDPWICIPHRADDDYVRRAAQTLRDSVDPRLKIYVEYSNETWNSAGGFTQTRYVQDQGEALGLSADRWAAGQFYCALRSVEIWEIFLEEFADDSRLVKVMASHSANINTTNLRVQALNNPALNPNRTMPDALAIAPYFGIVYTPQNLGGNYPTVDALVTATSQSEIEIVRGNVQLQKRVADAQGAELICYEGGQHYVGALGAENDATLTNLLVQANRDPRMYDRYREYLDMLEGEGIALFSNFSYVRAHSKFGSWGVLEYQDQPMDEAPKYRALVDWINAGAAIPGGACHDADQDCDGTISLTELLRGVQLFNGGAYHCDGAGEDGFAMGGGAQTCTPHTGDYNPQDWTFSLSELLRLVQLYQFSGIAACPGEGEDGFCIAGS